MAVIFALARVVAQEINGFHKLSIMGHEEVVAVENRKHI